MSFSDSVAENTAPDAGEDTTPDDVKQLLWEAYVGLLLLKQISQKYGFENCKARSEQLIADIGERFPAFPVEIALREGDRKIQKAKKAKGRL